MKQFLLYLAFLVMLFTSAVSNAQSIEHTEVDTLIETGNKAMNNGEYQTAIIFFEQALTQAEAEDYIQGQIMVYHRIEKIAIAQEDWKKCIECETKRAVLQSKIPWMTLEDRMNDCLNMPIYVSKVGTRDEAFDALSILKLYAEKIDKPLAYGAYLQIKGRLHAFYKEWDDAFECMEEAERRLKESDDPTKEYFLENFIGLLAGMAYQSGNFEESLKLYIKLAENRKNTYGYKSKEYAEALSWLANIEAFVGDIPGGAQDYIKAWKCMSDAVMRDINTTKPSERGKYWGNVEEMIWRMASYGLAAEQERNDFTAAGYEALMFGKGFLLSAERGLVDYVNAANDETLKYKYNQLNVIRKEVDSSLAHDAIAGLHVLYNQMDSLENDITHQLASSGYPSIIRYVTTDEISNTMKEGDVVIDFTDFMSTRKKDARFYAAYILKHGWTAPKLIKVFEEAQIYDILEQCNGRFSLLCNENNSRQIFDVVWKPIWDDIKDAKRVFFVPSGILHQTPVESIQYGEGAVLSDRLEIVRLTSSKEILDFDCEPQKLSTAALFGGLVYDMDDAAMLATAVKNELPAYFAYRGETRDMNGAKGFNPLRYSLSEVQEINEILSGKGVNTQPYTGTDGTEESFICMTGKSPGLLHISTHGFFYSPKKVPAWSSLNGYDNSMYLTGLVMSGGNAEFLGREVPQSVLGGLLTSSDIAMLDLTNTQLVILSACETALGETTNEGVYGLQRGFKKAGARTMVMSLWPVLDKPTKDFMIAFYKELADNGFDKRKAFKKAKNMIREKYDSPMVWASFIMVD